MELTEMSAETLVFLDSAFLVVHTALIFFNLFGWTWKKTLRLNLLSIFLTAGSWVAFAPWYGFGYCPCTDWHWQIKWAIEGDVTRLAKSSGPDMEKFMKVLLEDRNTIVFRDLRKVLKGKNPPKSIVVFTGPPTCPTSKRV